jgi:DNA-binding transcriptional regulator WhiA
VRLSSCTSNPFKLETSITASTLVPSSDYRDILSALQQPGIGLAVKDRSWFKVIIPNTFLGRHLVKVFLDYFCVNSSFQSLVRKTLFIKNSKKFCFSVAAQKHLWNRNQMRLFETCSRSDEQRRFQRCYSSDRNDEQIQQKSPLHIW